MIKNPLKRLNYCVGKRLQFVRNCCRYKVKMLSAATGIHINRIYRYEAGHEAPSLKNFRKLCLALNTTADFLLDTEIERVTK